jgi:hypothetical protein
MRPKPLTISELTRQIKGHLEGRFREVWVAGEVSNFRRYDSGQCIPKSLGNHAFQLGRNHRGHGHILETFVQDHKLRCAHIRQSLHPPVSQLCSLAYGYLPTSVMQVLG